MLLPDIEIQQLLLQSGLIDTKTMREVLVLYPGHPYAYDYIMECERAILSNESVVKQAPVPETPGWAWVIIVAIFKN